MRRLAMFIMVVLLVLSTIGYVSAHSITVDGSPTDWKADASTQAVNTWQLYSSSGEYVWKDAIGDVRNLIPDSVSIKIDGNLSDWDDSMIAGLAKSNGLAGAELDKMYVTWNSKYLYIAIKTNNTQSWDVAYGIGIDTNPGPDDTGYTGGTSPLDAWGRKIGFNDYEINYELYFWWSGSGGDITVAQLAKYDPSTESWSYTNLTKGTDYAYTGSSSDGLQTLEIRIPWKELGEPNGTAKNIAIISWITGGGGSSAVSSAPWDPNITANDANEWDDTDILSNLAHLIRFDFSQFRVTADSNYVYLLVEFENLSDIREIGMDGAPFIAIAINDGTGNETWFAGWSDTQTYNSTSGTGMKWKYQVVINIAASNYTGKNIRTAIVKPDPSDWGALFYITNDTWNLQNVSSALAAVSLPNNAIEIRLPRSMFANDGDNLEFELMVANGWSDYSSTDTSKQGGTWNIMGSNAIDAMTNVSGNTWNEVKDGVVNYYVTANITQVPFYHSLLAVLLILLAGLVIYRRL